MFNSRTRLIIINTPNNPIGKVYSAFFSTAEYFILFFLNKVFTQDELEQIASLCQKHDVLCISDEVYEWIVYDKNKKHIRMATLPNMWERTLTIGSAGKTFSSTGLRLGWTIGPEHLIRSCQIVHQVVCYTYQEKEIENRKSKFVLELCLYVSNVITRSCCTLL